MTGNCLPIALFSSLLALAHAKPLQAFPAGAALCCTSLGTTFTVLSTSGLTTTRRTLPVPIKLSLYLPYFESSSSPGRYLQPRFHFEMSKIDSKTIQLTLS